MGYEKRLRRDVGKRRVLPTPKDRVLWESELWRENGFLQVSFNETKNLERQR